MSRTRNVAALVVVGLVGALLASNAFLVPPSSRQPPGGTQPPVEPEDALAPPFDLPTDDGGRASLGQFRGRVLVLHFIELICCSDSLVEVIYTREVAREVDPQRVSFLTIAVPYAGAYSPERFREIGEFNWTLALDDGTVQAAYGAAVTSTFLVEDGRIVYRDDAVTSSADLRDALAGRGGGGEDGPEGTR